MKNQLIFYSSLLFLTASSMVSAITVEEVIAGIQEASRQQIGEVNNYWIQRDNFGISSFEYYEKLTAIDPTTGQTVGYMRMVPPFELYEGPDSSGFANASPTDLRAAADVLRSQGPRMENGLREEMAEADLPPGIVPMLSNPPPGQPWLSANPNDMMGMYAVMLEAGAEGMEQQNAIDATTRQEALNNPMSRLVDMMEIAGEETLNGRPVVLLNGNIPPEAQAVNGQEFTMNNLSIWVDTEKFVTMKMRIEGESRQDNEVRKLAIEMEEFNYQVVSGCSQFEIPLSRVMRMSGIMTPEEEAEISGQMAEMQRQLESLPPDQREMIMRQMGPQMAMMESMAAGNGIEMKSDVTQMSCNSGPPRPEAIMSMFTSGGGSTAVLSGLATPPATATDSVDSTADLTRVIQNRLTTLGYTPGNTAGELDTATVVAITQFEAASNLPVTGDATDELAAALLRVIDGGSVNDQVVINDEASRQAQQTCLEEKIAAAQQSQQTRRGFGGLLNAASRVASRISDVNLSGLLNDINDANATADDLAAAARDLGLTENDIDECRSL